MGLSARDAFKVGFLARCAAEGIRTEEIGPLVKQAEEKLAGVLGALGAGASRIGGKGLALGGAALSGLAGWGVPLALLAPPAAGAAAGYGLARMTDIDDTDVNEIKDQELLEEYRRQTEALNRESAMRRFARQRKQTGRMFAH